MKRNSIAFPCLKANPLYTQDYKVHVRGIVTLRSSNSLPLHDRLHRNKRIEKINKLERN